MKKIYKAELKADMWDAFRLLTFILTIVLGLVALVIYFPFQAFAVCIKISPQLNCEYCTTSFTTAYNKAHLLATIRCTYTIGKTKLYLKL